MSVSRIRLGMVNFDYESTSWRLDEEKSKQTIERAIDIVINFIDNVNVYLDGEREQVIGDVI